MVISGVDRCLVPPEKTNSPFQVLYDAEFVKITAADEADEGPGCDDQVLYQLMDHVTPLTQPLRRGQKA